MSDSVPAILVLGDGSMETARSIQQALPGALIHGLSGRVQAPNVAMDAFGDTMRQLFADDVPIIALCAAGIVIRALAPLLQDKRAEPPVLAVAEDGSAVVPLLGGLRGVNELARRIGEALGTVPAITTTGEIRFGATLERPPRGYEAQDPARAKRFMSDLLAGKHVRLVGDAPWLRESRLPFAADGPLSIVVTPRDVVPAEHELVFHPRSIAVAVAGGDANLAEQIQGLLAEHGLAPRAVAALFASERDAARPGIHAAAAALARPVRFVGATGTAQDIATAVVAEPVEPILTRGPVAVAVGRLPIDVENTGRARGRLCVIGLGPGRAEWMAPEARAALSAADDVAGYSTYLKLAGPFRAGQAIHESDNREELDRARHALTLAGCGRNVALVSSGDPGVFAMAAAVMEALHDSDDPAWHGVELVMVPGISAAQAAAARAGAPLGHDFCVISLSDNLKPWDVIERRLALAASADLALALYNPISRARPWQLGRALDILRGHRTPDTPVVLGRDVGRAGENVRVVSLGALNPDDVDMRTVVIVGSSTTRSFARADGGLWTYTPRWYSGIVRAFKA